MVWGQVGREVQDGGADSLPCTARNNNNVEQLYSNEKNGSCFFIVLLFRSSLSPIFIFMVKFCKHSTAVLWKQVGKKKKKNRIIAWWVFNGWDVMFKKAKTWREVCAFYSTLRIKIHFWLISFLTVYPLPLSPPHSPVKCSGQLSTSCFRQCAFDLVSSSRNLDRRSLFKDLVSYQHYS